MYTTNEQRTDQITKIGNDVIDHYVISAYLYLCMRNNAIVADNVGISPIILVFLPCNVYFFL